MYIHTSKESQLGLPKNKLNCRLKEFLKGIAVSFCLHCQIMQKSELQKNRDCNSIEFCMSQLNLSILYSGYLHIFE